MTGVVEYVPSARPRRGFINGGSFLLDTPARTPALWGDGEKVACAIGEATMIGGPAGVGKSTLAGNLVFGFCGIPGYDECLGMTVQEIPDGKRVVYLAMDRPNQLARLLRRLASPDDRALLDERLLVWSGPLDFSLVDNPEKFAGWLVANDAGVVIIDSLKDTAGNLSDETTGSALNTAFQECIACGIEVVALHHLRKAQVQNKKPNTLADIFGSSMLVNGMGSVFVLWGEAGDDVVELSHLKQPVEPIGPLTMMHDRKTARVSEMNVRIDGTGPAAARRRVIVKRMLDLGPPLTKFSLSELGEFDVHEKTVKNDLNDMVKSGLLGTEGQTTSKRWWHLPPQVSPPTVSDGGAEIIPFQDDDRPKKKKQHRNPDPSDGRFDRL